MIFTATDFVMSETTEQYLPADDTDDSCRLDFIEIVPGDRSAEVKQDNVPAVKQEPHDVCCVV